MCALSFASPPLLTSHQLNSIIIFLCAHTTPEADVLFLNVDIYKTTTTMAWHVRWRWKFIHHHTCLVMNQSHCLMHPSHSAHIQIEEMYADTDFSSSSSKSSSTISLIYRKPRARKQTNLQLWKYIGSERQLRERSEKNTNLCRRNSIRFHQQFYLILISSNSISC